MGLGKKVLIADQLGHLVSKVVDNEMITIRPELAWLTMAVFAIQIFFDFSGYTDMALGVGKMMGFNLPENFNFPYVSRSITDFWRRWHMTFATWIRDYIFTPLAFQMRYWGKAGIFIALMLTFMVCGMWHGPTWNYLIWGVIQGLFLGLEELFLLKYLKKLKGFAIIYSLFIIITCLTFFRMEHFSQSINYLAVMFSPAKEGAKGIINFFTWEHAVIIFVGVLLCIPFKWPAKWNTERWLTLKTTVTNVVLVLVFLLSFMRLVTATYNPFIYFKF
jgi:alginate O-acetyltransferase complex protein AlgI